MIVSCTREQRMMSFTDAVEDLVKRETGKSGGGDVCWELIESNCIDMDKGAETAAQIVIKNMP